MKKLILFISIFLLYFGVTYADNENTESSCVHTVDGKSESHCVNIIVSTDIPGINCSPIGVNKYECQVPKSTNGVMNMIGNLIKQFTFITSVIGVMMITVSGVLYSLGGIENGMKETAKKWIKQITFGLIILLLSGKILQLVAPWIFI